VSLRTWAAPLLLGVVRNPTDVGLFRGAQAPLQGAAAFTAPLRLILLTEQTRAWERGETEKVFREIRRYMVGAAALTAVVIVPLELAMPWLVKLFLGTPYAPATDAVRIVLVAAMIQLVLGVDEVVSGVDRPSRPEGGRARDRDGDAAAAGHRLRE